MKLPVARHEGSREGQAGRGDPEPAPHLSLTWARPAPADSRGTQGATSARHAREVSPGGRDPGPWQRPAPATDPIRSPPAAACTANPAQLPALRPASLEAPGPERGETPTHAPRPPRSGARSHRGLPRGTPGPVRRGKRGRGGRGRRGEGRGDPPSGRPSRHLPAAAVAAVAAAAALRKPCPVAGHHGNGTAEFRGRRAARPDPRPRERAHLHRECLRSDTHGAREERTGRRGSSRGGRGGPSLRGDPPVLPP